jgi:hypothetical protein
MDKLFPDPLEVDGVGLLNAIGGLVSIFPSL